jgi:HK97 family phage prohead protease
MASEERRDLGVAQAGIEVRAADADSAQSFVGHAAVFNSRTAIGNPLTWGFYEQVADGAFTKTLSEGDARMLIDHESAMVVSRVSADTLRLAQDKVGLAVDSDLDTGLSYVADLTANLRNGNITGMSFGFYTVKDQWDTETVTTSDGNEAEVEIRTLLEVRLLEVSPVTFPAYEETDAGLRALAYRRDRAAIAKRVPFLPAMSKLLADLDREPGESTRGDEETEPAASTRLSVASIARRRKALLARFPDLTRI